MVHKEKTESKRWGGAIIEDLVYWEEEEKKRVKADFQEMEKDKEVLEEVDEEGGEGVGS